MVADQFSSSPVAHTQAPLKINPVTAVVDLAFAAAVMGHAVIEDLAVQVATTVRFRTPTWLRVGGTPTMG
jgi:hypothetical protein